MAPDEADMEVWSLITAFPDMTLFMKICVLVLNLILAGTGTIAMSIFGGKTFYKTHFVIGLLQLLTVWTLVGYLWSIAWGVLVFLNLKGGLLQRSSGEAGQPGQLDMGGLEQFGSTLEKIHKVAEFI